MKRKRRPTLLAVLLTVIIGVLVAAHQQHLLDFQPSGPAAEEDGIAVYFSPRGGCERAVVEQVDHARHSIDVQAYSFTNKAIAEALINAHQRGLRVRVILDRETADDKYSSATFLAHHGIPTYLDGEHAIAHNKVMVIDHELAGGSAPGGGGGGGPAGGIIITGSFNFTRQAEESNAENLLVIQGKPKLVAAYEANFEAHLAHSPAYQ